MNEKLNLLYQRRSIRAYTDAPVSKEEIMEILKAGFAAPNGISRYAWHVTVIEDADTRNQIGAMSSHRHCCAEAPVVFLVSGDQSRYSVEPRAAVAEACWPQDCAAMVQNMLLAATGLGLGSLWMGAYPFGGSDDSLRNIVGLPEHLIPFALVSVGHGAEEKEPRTNYEESQVMWK